MMYVTSSSLLSTLLDFFSEKLGEVSEEQGEHFHQDIKPTVHRCHGFWKGYMLPNIVP